ncbi:type IV pilus biogenesis protein PilM [Geobacter sp. SVR]|uniref:type IV pilus biogenesis protein PilM n=1 Tax=Geobacter sp. SVR TaxID=2495594 RepID=UPI00143EFFD0|nr:pilus assembly protein PilM [Geobacter sp. SVR]BCS53664.1 pilus assembly protein PilM [Geobacter sp. SVR]GCF84139.1 pilus assembly protein PilM [Geobacter sp. SVR]
MLFSRKALGVEVGPAGVVFALLGGRADAPRLERVASRPLMPGSMRTSLREQNILDPQHFGDRLREAHALTLFRGTRVSVTLPDAVGRILLLDVEGRFKSRSEALDIIRWKLKKQIPFDVAEAHLDYQLLRTRDNGDMALLVTLVSRTVIGQYEDMFTSAGFSPASIELNIFSICRAFESRLALAEDVALISFYDAILGIVVFNGGIPEFVRIKELPGSSAIDNRAYMEINNSLLAYRERFPERIVPKVYCLAAPAVASEFCGMASEAAGVETNLLEAKAIVKPSDSAPADQAALFPYTAAIGAAMRSL